MQKELSPPAKEIIHAYLNLHIGSDSCNAPYFNNRTTGIRGGLAVQVGKGSPQEITDEASLIAAKKRIDISGFDAKSAKQFLVDQKLGIDCSGFTFHVLNAEVQARTGKTLAKTITFPLITNVIKRILAKHAPVTRTGTRSLAHDANSSEIPLADVQTGDMIIMLGYGPKKDRDHVSVVESVEAEANTIIVHYIHSLAWDSDGKYNHGVRRGTITIADSSKPLTEAVWEEQGATGNKNQTLKNAQNAQYLGIRRLHALSTS